MRTGILTAMFLTVFVPSWAQMLNDVAAAQNIEVVHLTTDHFGSGVSFYDFDNDGWDDLMFPLENDSVAFFKNVNGNFVQLASYLYAPGQMRQIMWVDYDDDGDLDLCATYRDIGLKLYRNNGGFSFEDVTASSGIEVPMNQSFGVTFADPDGDNDLDMYVANYSAFADPAYTNKLYINNGNGSFQDASVSAGVDNGEQLSFMGVWFDYNEDNLIDLHVINDKQPFADALYKNLGNGTFSDEAVNEGVANDGHNPMTSSVSDFDNDGDQDVFVTDLNNNWIINGVLVNNKLYVNSGTGSFVDTAGPMGLQTNDLSWGALWVDYNNDGYEDLYVGTSENSQFPPHKTSYFYRNEAGTGFTLINDSITGDIITNSPCPVKGDIDNDGFYDVVVSNHNDFPNVFSNSGNTNNYIKITPLVNLSDRLACGAKVKVYSDGMTQYQTVFCGSGICAQNSQHMIFGLGTAAIVDSVVVTFPSGTQVTEYSLAVNSSYVIHEPLTVEVEIVPGVDTLFICVGDTVNIGVPGYTDYLWNTGSTDSMINVTQPGDYSFEAMDGSYTTIVGQAIHVAYESIPVYQEIITQPICGISDFGQVQLDFIIPDDTLNTVIWSNGETGFVADSLLPGIHTYTITTVFGCTYQNVVEIEDAVIFNVQFTTTPATDFSGGSVQFYTFGGEAPFTYMIDTVEVSSFIDDLIPGTYTVDVIDANGCIVTVEFIINDETSTGIASKDNIDFKIFSADDFLWVCSEHNNEIQSIGIYDMNGQEVELSSKWIEVNDNCMKLPVDLPIALYHVRVNTEDRMCSTPVFIR